MPYVSEKWGVLYPSLQKVGVRIPPISYAYECTVGRRGFKIRAFT